MYSNIYQYQAANDPSNKAVNSADSEVDLCDKKSATQLPLFPQSGSYKNYTLFQELILVFWEKEQQRQENGEITKQTLEMLRCRLNGHLLAYFGADHIKIINHHKISTFINYLQNSQIGNVTINQYLGLLKRILCVGIFEGVLEQQPIFPKLKSKSTPRGSFTILEYKRLLRISNELSKIAKPIKIATHRNTANGAFIKYDGVPKEMVWLIGFMVNTFIRPVDIKLIKNKHIEILDGVNRYLRISMIETKNHAGQIISMRVAVNIFKKILAYQVNKGFGKPNDYVFFPEVLDRQGAISLISAGFKKILDKGNMTIGVNNEKRSLYSLRHTSITFRLLYGKGIDLLTLARNARTSVEMIERFYASNLTAEMNIDMLQSKRTSISAKTIIK